MGIAEPTVKCGYGPRSHYNSLARSFELEGHRVVRAEPAELYSADLDILVGVEFDFEGMPKRYRGRAYTTDVCVLGRCACRGYISSKDDAGKFIFGAAPDRRGQQTDMSGVKVIGYYSDEEGILTAMDLLENDDDDHSYERDRFRDYCDNLHAVVDFTVEKDRRAVLDAIADEGNATEGVSILLGGAPPMFLGDLVREGAKLTGRFREMGLRATLFVGNAPEEMRRDLDELGDSVRYLMPYDEYMHEVLSADVIITKPGWNTISDLIYYAQISSRSPHYILMSDWRSIPELIAQNVLERRGFTLEREFNRIEQISEMMQELQGGGLKSAKDHTRELARSIGIRSVVEIILADYENAGGLT
ncbi:MAG: hypothetical protein ABH879_09250 [archaeon]